MNILYIGPYKEQSINGIQSQVNLYNLSQTTHNIYAKNYGTTGNHLQDDLLFLENKPIITNIDMVVEHKKVSDISVNQLNQSMLLPIFDTYENINIYQNYTSICVNNHLESNILKSNNIGNNILLNNKSLPLSESTKKNIDLQLYSFYTKIYCVSDLKTDVNIVYLLISSFSYILQHLHNHCLVVLLNNSNNYHLKKFSEFIAKISNQLGIDMTQKILLVNSQTCDINNIDYIHQKCDIFLNINNKESINSFNSKIAEDYNNNIIDDISLLSIIDGSLEIGINYPKLLKFFDLLSSDTKEVKLEWENILK